MLRWNKAALFYLRRVKIIVCTFADNVFCPIKWKRNIFFGKKLNFYHFSNRMMIVFSNGNNHMIANIDTVIISDIVVTFISFVKFHATVNVILFAALYFPVDRRVEDFTKAIKTDEIPYCVSKIAPGFRQCFLVVGSLDNTP